MHGLVCVCVFLRQLFVDYRVFRSFELHSIFISTSLIFERSQTIKCRPGRIEIKRNCTCDCMPSKKKRTHHVQRCGVAMNGNEKCKRDESNRRWRKSEKKKIVTRAKKLKSIDG